METTKPTLAAAQPDAAREDQPVAEGAAVPGATGQLRLDGFGNVVRVPAWSSFAGGEIVALGQRGG